LERTGHELILGYIQDPCLLAGKTTHESQNLHENSWKDKLHTTKGGKKCGPTVERMLGVLGLVPKIGTLRGTGSQKLENDRTVHLVQRNWT